MEIHRSCNILIGAIGLLIGALVYMVDRDPGHIYFLAKSSVDLSLYHSLPNLFGPLGNSLPTFIHVFSFILITAGLMNPGKKGCLVICLFWFAVDILFEFGQKFKTWTVKLTPDWFSGIPYLENSRNYFLYGSFDVMDVGSIVLGAISAYLVLLITTKETSICKKQRLEEN